MALTSSLAMPLSERATYLDTIIRVVLAVYIAVLPFTPLLIVERSGFLVLLGLLAVWCVSNRRVFYSRTPYDMLLLAFVVWVGFTIPFAVAPSYSLAEYGKLLQHMVVFYAVIFFFRELRARQFLLGLIGIVAVVVTAYGLSQFNPGIPQAVVSFFFAEVWLTTFLVMGIPFALVLALGDGPPVVRGGGIIVAGLMIACLFATQSRAGLVALLVEIGVVAWFIRSVSAKLVGAFLTVCVISVVLLVSTDGIMPVTEVRADIAASISIKNGSGSISHRIDIWRFSLSELAKHWLVGIGYGNLSYLFLYGQNQEVVAPGHFGVMRTGTHNIILYLALHVGLPGLLLFWWFIVRIMRKTTAEYRSAHEWLSKAVLLGTVGSVAGMMLRLQFDQMFVGSLAVFFWVLLALAVSSYPSRVNEELLRQKIDMAR